MIEDLSNRGWPAQAGRLGFLLVLLLTLSGCVTGVIDENGNEATAQRCPDPLQGSRYALCARLSSSAFGSGEAGGKRVLATVDSAHEETSSSRYTLQGGTFHAYR